jgi:predicted nucleic acid-binding protein
MVAGLVDSSVLIDALRRYTPAVAWIRHQQNLGVTQIVWLELIEGAQDKNKLVTLLKFLKMFEQVRLLPDDLDWAIDRSIRYRLSHQVSMMDCLIASASARLQIPTYTSNLKHFQVLIGQLAQKPY